MLFEKKKEKGYQRGCISLYSESNFPSTSTQHQSTPFRSEKNDKTKAVYGQIGKLKTEHSS